MHSFPVAATTLLGVGAGVGTVGMESRNLCSLEERSWVLWNGHRDVGGDFLS